MKIVIAGGGHEAEFIAAMFKGRENKLVIINPSEEVASNILKRMRVPVYVGEPWRRYVLEEANAHDADVFIALCPSDTDNYASCMMARDCFEAKKTICVVSNPKNVDLFKRLGVDSVISSSYLLGQSLKNETSVENLIKSFSLENNKIIITEAVVLSNYKIANKQLKDINFPSYASISCIFRTPDVIIPKGDTIIKPKDNLLIVCAPEEEKKVQAFISEE